MFDLEPYILRWRRGMATWGLPAEKLDELEEHIRDAFEAKVEQGIDEPRALMSAINELGDPEILKSEYRKETIAKWLDRTRSTTLSFSAMRTATLVSLLMAILVIALEQSIELSGISLWVAVLFYALLMLSIWATMLMCGLVVIAAIQRLQDSHQRYILAFVTMASITTSILVFNRPTTIGWGGASWIYVVLLVSFFVRGKKIAVGAPVACGLILLVSILLRPPTTMATLNMQLLYRTLIDITPAVILTYVLATTSSDKECQPVRTGIKEA